MESCCRKNECICGAEGSGTIEDIAEGLDQNLRGRKVAFFHDGWAQYVVKDQDDLLFLDNNVDLKMAADGIVNPLTALCMLKLVRDCKAELVVLDGAGTQMAKMLIKLFQKENIEVLPVAANKNDFNEIRSKFNIQNMFDQSAGDFEDRFSEMMKDRQKVIYISMQGGDFPGKILNRLPAKTEMILMGNLAEEDLKIPAQNFYFQSKRVRGFFLERFLREELDEETQHKFFHCIAEDLKSGGKIFGTNVAKEMKLEEWDTALKQIDDKNLQGKIILQCN